MSFIGFDLRGKVADFQENNAESITSVKQVLFKTIIPTTQTSLDEVKQFAEDNDLTVENAKKALEILNEYKDDIDLEEYGIVLPESFENSSE